MIEEIKKQQDEMSLPDNAFSELKPGEKYVPVMRPDRQYPEVTPYSVSLGLIMAVIFSAAAAYLGLKVGQVFEAAIPIAIIAAGIAGVTKRKDSLGENVMIQSIGAASGIVVAGAIFTLPALYILQAKYPEITVNFLEVFLSSLLGGLLGILFFIPFRKYFVSDMHGNFPFPEATATTQVLISGQKGGSDAKPLLIAGLVGGLYDFFASTFKWWAEDISTSIIPAMSHMTDKLKMVFKINTGAAVLGLGYIVGLRYSFIIFAGSAFIWWIIVPLMGTNPELAGSSAEEIFKGGARFIGIGGIAMSGIIGPNAKNAALPLPIIAAQKRSRKLNTTVTTAGPILTASQPFTSRSTNPREESPTAKTIATTVRMTTDEKELPRPFQKPFMASQATLRLRL